jgi:predicted  nucleic acid-binding Zn-ribbon protein
LDSSIPPETQDRTEPAKTKDEVLQELHQQWESAKRDLGHSAEQLAASERQVEAPRQQLKAAEQSTPEQQKPDGRWRFSPLALLLGGFVLASAGTFGGFKAGTHVPDNSQTKLQLEAELQKEEALVKERAAQVRKLQDLQHALDSAGQGGKQLAEELAAKVQAAQKLSATVQKLQSDLAVARADLAAARTEVEAKARAQQQLGQNLKQSTQQVSNC